MNADLKSTLQLARKAVREAKKLGLVLTADDLQEIVSELAGLAKLANKKQRNPVLPKSAPERHFYH